MGRCVAGAIPLAVVGLGSVPVTCETPRKRRENKRAFAPITRYRDTTRAFNIYSFKCTGRLGGRRVRFHTDGRLVLDMNERIII